MHFVDTNILVYAVSATPAETEKAQRARALLDGRDLALSVQVLQEFYVQATRPGRRGALSHDEAVRFAIALTRFHVQDLTLAVMHAAFTYRERFGLAYWDCAILAAASACGCGVVYSEDLSHEQDYDGIRVVNPFA